MKKITLILLLTAVAVVSSFAQSADSTFDNYLEATGGKTLWNSVKTYSLKQVYVSNAPSDFDMEVKASLTDGAMLKTKTIMKRNFIYAISPTDAFLRIPMGSRDKAVVYDTKDLSDKEKANMKREVNDMFAPFYDYNAKNYIATYVGVEELEAQKVHHIELTGKDVKYDLYFDAITNLLTKQKETLATGEEITKQYTAYTTSTFGIKYPSAGTYYSSIDKRNVKLTTVMVFNPAFDGATFKR